ncbi:unnamed protein product [Calypogeia fissa]
MGPGRAAAGGGGGNGGGGRSGGMAGVNKVLTEEEKLFHPCFEAYANGAWWEVEILQRMPLAGGAEKFLIQYVGLKDEESESREWVSLDFLRLRARQADSWDCQILTRGVDVSVCGVPHPQAGQLRTPSNTGLYDAKIVKIIKSEHDFDCCCKYFLQFFIIKDGTISVHGVERALVRNPSATGVDLSRMSILQRPGYPLNEILKAHISTKSDGRKWSLDALFLTETDLTTCRTREGRNTTPRGAFLPDMSEEGIANPDGRQGTAKGHHSVVSRALKFSCVENNTRHGRGWADAPQKNHKREVNEGDHRGMPSPQNNGVRYSDRGLKRKHEYVEEKEISNIEDYSPEGTSRLTRSKDLTAGGSGRQGQNVGLRVASASLETFFKVREPADRKRARKLQVTDSESSPDANFPESFDNVNVDSDDHNSERGSTRDVFLKRGRREEEQPGKADRHHEHKSSRYEPYRPSEQLPQNKNYGISKQGKSEDIKWKDEDRDPQRYYNPKKAEKRSKAEKDSKPEVENSGRRRGRPRKHPVTNGTGCELREEKSPRDVNDNQGRPEHSNGPEHESRKLDADFDNVRVFGDSQGIETSREISRRATGKPPERSATQRSSERLQKVSPAKPITNPKEHKTDDIDPGSAKTDVYLSPSSPNSEGPASELGCLRKLRPRDSLKTKKSHHKMQRDAEKENGAKEKVIDRPPPVYKDLLTNNVKEDDDYEGQPPTSEKTPVCGLKDTWDPMAEDVYSDDSDCNVVSEKEPLPKTLWEEFDEPEPAVGNEQVWAPSSQEAAQPEVHDSDRDIGGITCEHKNQVFKDDSGRVCSNCGIITERIEDLVPQVEIPQRRPREADLDEWDLDTYSADGNQGAVGSDDVKNEEVVNMLNTSLPAHYAVQMHPHQKDGFEFLWRNLGYDAVGKLRTKKADRNAGCILSHAPGTGKSFLIIAFLRSYLDRFPKSRPLIVAPKIMLLRWQKEFVRWKSDIKVFILNTASTSGKRLLQKHEDAGLVRLKSHQMNSRAQVNTLRSAVLLEWKRERSVCLVSYNLFSALTDEESANRTQEGEGVRMCLLDSPGILILDEGHFPRNKDTRIRNALMKMKTNARILLSGTLFQNNFEELFNIFYLVRPGFVETFLDMWRNGSERKLPDDHPAVEEVTEASERKARKLFVEEIGMKIEEGHLCKWSAGLQHGENAGLQMLQRLTENFIHHHPGEVLACLPGLRDFGILLKPPTLQSSLLEVVDKRFDIEDEHLKREIAVSVASIHPKLVTKLEFFHHDIIDSLGDGPKSDMLALLRDACNPQDGVKTKFVFDLLSSLRSTSEKVLIFSQHHAPLEMLEDMFKQTFNWDKNKDVLRLDGTMGMSDREAVIERFNDPFSQVQVLLASTKACGEGINLVGASRVVFLDVLWNPAVIKQAISRAFRLGQKKIVYVYRLIAIGTIEETKYKKAIRKDWLSVSIFTRTAAEAGEDADGEVVVQTDEIMVDPPESISSKKQSSGEEILVWEVDADTCEDDLLEKLLKKDKTEGNSFIKIVEHSSQFNSRKTACGPNAWEWFADERDKDLSHTKEAREGDEIEVFEADVCSGSDTDEEILETPL